jgi:hypothetical protein
MPPIAIPSSAAATPTAATPSASSSATKSSAAPAGRPLPCLIDGKGPPVERLPIQFSDSRLRVLVVRKFDERESARLTGHAIGDNADTDDLATAGRAGLA